jgi:hypothetical protein
MNWNERAEDALISLFMVENARGWYPHFEIERDKVNSYIRESAERIAMLEKALEQAMETNLQLQVIEAPCILSGVSPNHIGKECITFGGYYPGEVLGLADEYPELAQWLREREGKVGQEVDSVRQLIAKLGESLQSAKDKAKMKRARS